MKFRSHPKHAEVRAYVNWEEIAKINEATNTPGLYVWASVMDQSIVDIQKLLIAFPHRKQLLNPTEYHATIIHSKTQPANPHDFPQDRFPEFLGAITHFEPWQDHKDRTIVVARVDSPGLQSYHEYFLRMGFKSDFPEYNAHITVAKNLQRDQPLMNWLESVNASIRRVPEPIRFDGTIHGSSLA